MPLSRLDVQSFGPRPIDTPVSAVKGLFAHRTIRAVLDEVQKAELGRKCGTKDRRPLDPPPVVRLRLFETIEGETAEREITDMDESVAYGYTCFVDLFPWPPPAAGYQRPRPAQQELPHDADPSRSAPVLPTFATLIRTLFPGTSDGNNVADTPTRPHTQDGSTIDPHSLRLPPLAASRPPKVTTSADDIAAVVDGIPIPEHANCTQSLVGATFVSASCLHFGGKTTLLFAFPDLACNMDGTFLIRYRAMNIFNVLETDRLPIIAECWGGPATVYPTKDFPGLSESTELTKYLSRFGVPVNIRQGERKRRTRRDSLDEGPSAL